MATFSRTAKATAMTAAGSVSEKGKEEGFYCKGQKQQSYLNLYLGMRFACSTFL